MKAEYKNEMVLAMYDIRGIQRYIFATNEVRDIIGASILVDDIILSGLRSVIKKHADWSTDKFITDWEDNEKIEILEDESVQMQVLFIGGGNAYVLYRKGIICETVNRELAKYVLEKSYSLNLAVAVVRKTDNYMTDYDLINHEMRKVKAQMAPVKPIGAIPFMEADSITGYPLSTTSYSGGEKKYITTESACKQLCLSKLDEKERNAPEKIFDNMVTKKGDNSTLAVIHIDGNSMGKRIKNIMQAQQQYEEAVKTMRAISRNIKNSFLKAFSDMCDYMDKHSDKVVKEQWNHLYRKIVTAGDDITFICNPCLAIPAVEAFIASLTSPGKNMYQETGLSAEENHLKYGFSACAGIAFFNSHFPFSDAYQVAEACCSTAKAMAKSKEHRNGQQETGMIGCYVDFQFCVNIRAAQLGEYRKKNYSLPEDEGSMLMRPYYISAESYRKTTDLDANNIDQNIEIFWGNLKAFTTWNKETKLVRSHAKELRNAYSFGMDAVDKYVTFLESRSVKLPETDRRTWYDALEVMDFYKEGIR